jgi:DNA helicase-2/ATP-dependent DNA helicase PcrA
VERLAFFDTLPMARALCPGSAKLGDLARTFGVDAGRSHHALDDASTIVGVVRHLNDLAQIRTRKTALPRALGWLGLGFAVTGLEDLTAEEKVLLDLARPIALGRFGNVMEDYAEEAVAPDAPSAREVIDRLGGEELMTRLRTEKSPAERYPAALARLEPLVAASAAPTLEESIELLLARLALSGSRADPEIDRRAVNLLTLHSTKGLEFSRVYVIGAEDGLLPGHRELGQSDEKALQEARRLLYVGMTRAIDRLVLTRVVERRGQPAGGDLLLREAGLDSGRADGTAD